jgi:Tfp pilus assembly protein PilO
MKTNGPNPTLYAMLFGFALLAGSGAAYWQYSNFAYRSQKVQALRKELNNTQALQQELQQSESRLLEAQREIEHLETSVTTVEYVPTLLKDLQRTAEACSLKVTAVRPAPPVQQKSKKKDEGNQKARKPYEEIDVEVKTLGSFESTMAFLRKLEDFPKIVSVRYVSVDPKVDGRTRALEGIETTFNVRVYAFSALPTSVVGEWKSQETQINLSPQSRGLNQDMEGGQ